MAFYVVTGGAGFIGSHVVEELVRRGETVRVIDNLSMGSLGNIACVRGRVEFHERDIRELAGLRPVFSGATCAIHLAALASVARSVEDPIGTNEVNITGTLNVLVAARDAGVRRLIFAASAAAYGNNPVMPRVENLMPDPLSPYALHKLAGEHYCTLFHSLYGLEAVPLRFFNIFGPRQNPQSPYSGVLSKFVAAYSRQQQPVIFGDGEQSRDFTYVENVVDAVLRACTAAGAPGKIINVGVGKSYTLNQTVGILNRIYGREVKPRYDAPRQGDARESLADISLARQVLGYQPLVSFEEGLRRTVEWYGAEAEKGAWG